MCPPCLNFFNWHGSSPLPVLPSHSKKIIRTDRQTVSRTDRRTTRLHNASGRRMPPAACWRRHKIHHNYYKNEKKSKFYTFYWQWALKIHLSKIDYQFVPWNILLEHYFMLSNIFFKSNSTLTISTWKLISNTTDILKSARNISFHQIPLTCLSKYKVSYV